MRYKSLIGGAIGDVGFESGDLIDVPDDKADVWLAAGLIESPSKSQMRRLAVTDVAEGDV